jgi:hypothetical protein
MTTETGGVRRGIRRNVWLAVLGWIAVLAALVIVLERRSPTDAPAPSSAPVADAVAPQPSAAPEADTAKRARQAAVEEPVPYIENLVWGDIDLREAQAVMPDNLYWQLGAPTSDPEVLAAREEEKKRRNEEYGLVLSGDANAEQVDAYYDYRELISTDFLEFAEWMKNRYAGKINDEFEGLLDLSIKLHKARLAQIPADRQDAIQRSKEREKIREDWRREQAEFDPPKE